MACLWILAGSSGFATTVVTVKNKCPVCGETFLGSEIGSWFQFTEPGRDFSGTLFVSNLKVETCPYCLFTAGDMKALTPAVRKRARAVLAELPSGLPPLSAKERAQLRQSPGRADFLVNRLADLCNAQLEPDPGRDALIALRLYYQSGTNRVAATRRAVTALQKWVADDKVAREQPNFVYLLGELQRRAGETEKAAATLARAARLLTGEANQNTRQWAVEQRRLAEKGISTAPAESGSMGDSEGKSARALRARLPAFLADQRAGRPEQTWLLPAVAGRDPVHETLGAANKLVEQGDRRATEYVLRWLAGVEEAKLDDYPEPYCLQALARHPEIGKALLPQIHFRSERMADAARYACGRVAMPAVTISALQGKAKWLPTDNGITMAATIRRDPALKPVLLSRAVNAERWPSFEAAAYLNAVVSVRDIPAIERRVRAVHPPRNIEQWDERTSQRQELEGVLLKARLAALAEKL